VSVCIGDRKAYRVTFQFDVNHGQVFRITFSELQRALVRSALYGPNFQFLAQNIATLFDGVSRFSETTAATAAETASDTAREAETRTGRIA
jgi:hypothetical protein